MMALANGGEVWQLSYDDQPDDDFVDGLRLSTDCLSRRIIEPLDPSRYHEFPEHLGHRGHGFERVMQEWLRIKFGVVALREIVVPWEYGESHLDLFIPEPGDAWDTGGRPCQIELKANKDAQVRTENIRQVQRQMFAMERAIAGGKTIRYRALENDTWVWRTIDAQLYADADWRIIVIDPTTWRIPNPAGVRVTISDERRAELEAEWAVMTEVMNRTPSQLKYDIYFPGAVAPCSCGKCDPDVVLDELPRDLYENARSYLHAMSEESDAKEAKKFHGDVLKPGLLKLRANRPELTDTKGSWVGGGVKVTITKAGSLRVSESDQEPFKNL